MLTKYRNNFFWNFYLRAILEAAIDIGILGLMDTHEHNFSNFGYSNSFIFALFSMGAILSMVLWIRLWLRKQDLTDEALAKRVGSIYDGLKPRPDSLLYQEWFILRRLAFSASAFYGMHHLWLNFQVIFFSTLISLAINSRRPFETILSFKVE